MHKKHLGQNFLFDPFIIQRIISAARLDPEDLVVEIGPGPGRMTRMLADTVTKVVAIELDDRLYEKLKSEFSGVDNVELVHGDALEYPYENLPEFNVVANIPYYITTPIIFKLLQTKKVSPIMKQEDREIIPPYPPLEKGGGGDFQVKNNLKSMTLTVQKEVAERIAATPGGKEYGVLSLMVQYLAEPECAFIIPKEAFRPVPKVDSTVVHMKIRNEPSVHVRDEQVFFRVIKTAFSQRRKMLSNSLKSISSDADEWLDRAGIDPKRRPETLSIEEFARLADTPI
jgi:16S rRNA (adenine1518-N6/adenine1519-N6)-dimethyltransferase